MLAARNMTMGWVKRRRNGRVKAIPSVLENVLSGWSYAVYSSVFPVSLIKCFFFRSSITGAYVSFRKSRAATWTKPHAIVVE